MSSLIFITSLSCFAEINVINNTGFSRLRGPLVGEINPAVNTIYAGTSGDEADCDERDGTTTCNNCTATTDECNSNRIYENLILAVTFTSNNTAGLIAAGTADNTNVAIPLAVTDVNIYQPNTQVTVQIRWSDICPAIFDGATNCDDADGIANLRIGIDSDSNSQLTNDGTDDVLDIPVNISKLTVGAQASLCTNGSDPGANALVCNFVAYPGDQKVYIDDVRTECNFPNTSGSQDVRAIRFLYKQGEYPANNEGTFADLTVSDNGTCATGDTSKVVGLSENEISGLANNEPYFFRVAVVDEAGNVGHFASATGQTSVTAGGNTDTSTCFDTSAIGQNCHVVFPASVTGLLEDDLDCFITTATYGSPFKSQVRTFRTFRNLFLNSSVTGRLLIKTYYRLSPPVAKYIHNNKHLKPYAR
ncbi:MAG: hypothetical protein HRT44_03290, partial [Bdellovibrionales bacterium]|nr:hypothetical protein [Bdellovibrionales bacterium]NQZ18271.1 hypothetical protein [Bdellovibrionales bacterium]